MPWTQTAFLSSSVMLWYVWTCRLCFLAALTAVNGLWSCSRRTPGLAPPRWQKQRRKSCTRLLFGTRTSFVCTFSAHRSGQSCFHDFFALIVWNGIHATRRHFIAGRTEHDKVIFNRILFGLSVFFREFCTSRVSLFASRLATLPNEDLALPFAEVGLGAIPLLWQHLEPYLYCDNT